MRVGADTGGTFSDLVDEQGTVVKVLSTPADPDLAVVRGIELLGRGDVDELAHGTTVATNALLEGRLAPVALITTEGLADVIEIGRQDRPSLYDQFIDRPAALVPRARRYEVTGRMGPDGVEITPIDLETLPAIPDEVVAVAVCLLHSDLNPTHERAVAAALARPGLDVVPSCDVSPEFREFERTVTTVVNAGLRPLCRHYLERLGAVAERVWVMASSGGLLEVETAASLPAALLLSGPAGGVRAAAAAASACGFSGAITFDMGGTSTDVCLVHAGEPVHAGIRSVGGHPVRFPSLDIHTIGAGGGSIASIDPGGALVVGPGSAGADPGPACYGRGGSMPTVTDANLVAGRITVDAAFGGLALDRVAAATALARIDIDAAGVIDVVNATMVRALRSVSVERGVDPTDLALVAFGGAGPLHACDLAESMGMSTVIVPARAGVLSAVGLLTAAPERELVRSWPTPDRLDGLDQARTDLARAAVELIGGQATVATFVDCRYRGQAHELTVDSVAAFHGEHEQRNGFARPETPVEVIALRARATRPPSLALATLPVPAWRVGADAVIGPAVIAEPDCTIWVAPGWVCTPGAAGALVLRRQG